MDARTSTVTIKDPRLFASFLTAHTFQRYYNGVIMFENQAKNAIQLGSAHTRMRRKETACAWQAIKGLEDDKTAMIFQCLGGGGGLVTSPCRGSLPGARGPVRSCPRRSELSSCREAARCWSISRRLYRVFAPANKKNEKK